MALGDGDWEAREEGKRCQETGWKTVSGGGVIEERIEESVTEGGREVMDW